MMDDATRHDLMERVAIALLETRTAVEVIVKDLSDEDASELAQTCRREAHPEPGDSHNFEMPEYDHVAELIEGELRIRRFFRRAAEYETETGRRDYCTICDGACTPDHRAEMEEE